MSEDTAFEAGESEASRVFKHALVSELALPMLCETEEVGEAGLASTAQAAAQAAAQPSAQASSAQPSAQPFGVFLPQQNSMTEWTTRAVELEHRRPGELMVIDHTFHEDALGHLIHQGHDLQVRQRSVRRTMLSYRHGPVENGQNRFEGQIQGVQAVRESAFDPSEAGFTKGKGGAAAHLVARAVLSMTRCVILHWTTGGSRSRSHWCVPKCKRNVTEVGGRRNVSKVGGRTGGVYSTQLHQFRMIDQ